MTVYDFVIVGAGMAGASLAAELASHGSVLLLEAEDTPGYHATGRSAAFWDECYGGPDVVPLTLASGPWLREHGFLRQRGALYIGREQDAGALDSFAREFEQIGARLELVERDALKQRVPGLRDAWKGGVWEPGCADIDVAELHQHYLRSAAQAGAELRCRARVGKAERTDELWRIAVGLDEVRAGILINAAGAWADDVAANAGVAPLGLLPLSRTVVQLRTDPAPPPDMPLVLDINGGFYFKPEAGRLWLSPHDERPSAATDAAPDELSVAEAIARFEEIVDWRIAAVERRWAGLRTFAPDRRPVYGFDRQADGFFWFAGQGGFGIQTAPAAARLAAQILLGQGGDAMTRTLDPDLYRPRSSQSEHAC